MKRVCAEEGEKCGEGAMLAGEGSAIIMDFTHDMSCHFFPFNLKMDISKSTTLTFSVIIHFLDPV